MAPRSSARSRPWTRCSKSRAKRRASRAWSTSPGCRRSTTARRCRARGVLYHTQGLERAQQRRRPDVAVQQPQRRSRRHPGGGHPGDAAAADPGRRQRRRLHHAGRAARRQLRHGQVAERYQRDRCQCQDAVGAADGAGVVPLERSAIPARGRPGEDRGAAGSPRSGIRRARGLSRIDLRQPVQPIRPRVPGLRAGRLAIAPADRGHREHVRAQQGREDDPAWNAGEDHADGRPLAHQPVQSLSDGDDHRPAGAGRLLGPGADADGGDRAAHASPGTGFEWSAMSYQEKLVGNQMYIVFALALLLVYLVLAGQYESWYAPISVILSVPLSFIGPVLAVSALTESGLNNNLYVQIGLVLLMALSAKNAILIVEFARELRAAGKPILDAATEAARARFRPIVMTSLAFILGVVPLVLASGAGASARVSIGITVFTGMIASTCLAVLFVPPFFAVVQHVEEWRKARKDPSPAVRRPNSRAR